MSEGSQLIEKLKDRRYREAYIRASINVNLPSQIRALRLKRGMSQVAFAGQALMRQPRVSAMEKPGATNFNVETLVRVAAAFQVGLAVRFIPFSEMLKWENSFSQDSFDVVTFEKDRGLQPIPTSGRFVATTTNTTWMSGVPVRALPEVGQSSPPMPPPPQNNGATGVLEFRAG
jgi:transcriptional regulator with XRE-family HTH domain